METAESQLDGAAETEAPQILAPWHDDHVRAGFLRRHGGVSRGVYASFNLAHWIGDDAAAAAENWRRWHACNPGLRPTLINQVHGTEILRVRAANPNFSGERPAADGMVTNEIGIALCVFSADCVPILLYDDAAHVIAALHAGWRGTLAGIATAGIRAMVEVGARPDQIRAALGPAIGSCCFEVDEELAIEFARRIPFTHEFIRQGGPRKAYIDLRGIIRRQLEEAGLDPGLISRVGPCTRCNSMDFFSRRAAEGAVTGLQMSFIALNQSSDG